MNHRPHSHSQITHSVARGLTKLIRVSLFQRAGKGSCYVSALSHKFDIVMFNEIVVLNMLCKNRNVQSRGRRGRTRSALRRATVEFKTSSEPVTAAIIQQGQRNCERRVWLALDKIGEAGWLHRIPRYIRSTVDKERAEQSILCSKWEGRYRSRIISRSRCRSTYPPLHLRALGGAAATVDKVTRNDETLQLTFLDFNL